MEDLFEGYDRKGKSRPRDVANGFYISPETFIGGIILIILICIGVFSIGIMTGKNIVRRQMNGGKLISYDAGGIEKADDEEPAELAAEAIPEQPKEQTVIAKPHVQPEVEEKDVLPKKGKQYVVQLIVYKGRTYAEREMKWLKDNKFSVYKREKNGKIILYAGPYDTKEAANAAKKKLRSRYKDCFVLTKPED